MCPAREIDMLTEQGMRIADGVHHRECIVGLLNFRAAVREPGRAAKAVGPDLDGVTTLPL